MKIELKDFQQEAVDDLVAKVRYAAEGAVKVGLQAVVLSAPTGSGKTMIATALIERILNGDDEAEPDPDATFLWVTDLPELNEQTYNKMDATSEVLNTFNLQILETNYDRRVFEPGRIYFLNTQKLGKDKLLTQKGDGRNYSIWETVQNTAVEPGVRFFLIIDEAHRGMRTRRDEEAATTIIQRFLKGSTELDPVPVVIGISATPARFDALLEGQGRTVARTEVEVARVRESGLLKDKIIIFGPEDDQQADMTLLGEATRHWQIMTKRWADYCETETIEAVIPILVVQVENAPSGATGTKTPLGTAIATINESLPAPLPLDAFAHCFDVNSALDVEGRTIRYIAPSHIASDRNVRVVFFKSALSTGWDCPQAETMMSFRKAADATYIAQLVGRMVRTPLARRVHADESLNSVALYLPHYDEDAIKLIVARLQDPDYEYVPPIEVELGSESVTLHRAHGTEAIFEALIKVPTYVVPSNRKTKQTRRLMRMARALVKDGLDADAAANAETLVIGLLDTAMTEVEQKDEFAEAVAEKGVIRIGGWEFDTRTSNLTKTSEQSVEANPVNINHLFNEAGRHLGEGLHLTYWRHRTEGLDDIEQIRTEKIKVAALLSLPAVRSTLDQVAADQVESWHRVHIDDIEGLPEKRLDLYDQLLGGAANPTETKLPPGDRLLWRKPKGAKEFKKHIFRDETERFYDDFRSSWEVALLEAELPKPEIIGWLRNRDRQRTSLRVPYQQRGKWLPVYPDFIFFRQDGKGVVVDILDPHDPTRSEAVPKAKGLAIYAERHGARFGRIQLIAKVGDRLRRLELTDPKVRKQLLVTESSDALIQLYETAGL